MTVSLIVYGRNDQVGYNAHKRVAMSLNAMAEVLTHADDEILFTDYNTEDSQPTQLEAMADTLTDKAKRLLRVFRVRPSVHFKYANLTPAQVNEPLARNVALRRSNPANKWILSTNTDMIFIPQSKNMSLSDIIGQIKDEKYYAISRFEIPETLWESLDRLDPVGTIRSIDEFGRKFHLNEITLTHRYNYYDAPGDFQLFPRKNGFEIYGFDERMIHGWHVDSNFSKRHMLKYGLPESLQDRVYGYHTSHTKLAGWMHSRGRVLSGNCLEKYVNFVSDPYAEHQKETWGLNGEEIEEIRLKSNSNIAMFSEAMSKVMPGPLLKPLEVDLTSLHEKANILNTEHALSYVFEQLMHLKSGSTLFYIGMNNVLLKKLIDFSKASDKKFNILYYNIFKLGDFDGYIKANATEQLIKHKKSIFNICVPNIKCIMKSLNHNNINCVILDCSIDSEYYSRRYKDIVGVNLLERRWIKLYNDILCGLPKNSILKVIGICVHLGNFSEGFLSNISMTASPFTSRVVHGYTYKASISSKILVGLYPYARFFIRATRFFMRSVMS